MFHSVRHTKIVDLSVHNDNVLLRSSVSGCATIAKKLLSRLTAILVLASTVASAGAGASDSHLARYAHSRWMRDDGVPVHVHGFTQDDNGFLWLAGSDGLYRFDGARFEKVAQLPSKSPVSKVLAMPGGEIWAWFKDQDLLGIYARGRLRMVPPPRLWQGPSEVTQMARAKDGGVWVGHGQLGYPLLRYREGRWDRFGTEAGLPRAELLSLVAAPDGSIWVSYIGAVLRLAPGGRRFDRILASPDLRSTLALDASRRVWLVDRRRAYVLLPGERGRRGLPDAIDHTDPGKRLGRSLIDGDGDLWMATRNDGVLVLANPSVTRNRKTISPEGERFTADDGLSSNNTDAIFKDRDGAIWIATSRGIDRFRSVAVVAEPELARRAAFGNILYAGTDGTVYIGQRDGVWKVRSGRAPEILLRGIEEPEAICEDRAGYLVVVDAHAVFRLKGAAVRKLARPPTETGIYDCAFDRSGRLWMSAAGAGMYAWQGNSWESILADYSKAGFHPNGMLRESSQAIVLFWAPGVVARVDPPRPPSFLLRAGSPLGEPLTLFEDSRGLLIGGERGIARIRAGKAQYLLRERIPELARINGIVQTKAGDTWLQGSAGLLRIATDDLQRGFADRRHKPTVKVFGFDEGMPDSYSAESWRSLVQGGDGRIWLDTLAGTASIDPATVKRNVRPPVAVVTSLRALDGLRIDPGDIVLAKGVGDLEIAYSGLGISSPTRARFRYRLIGNDETWIEAGTRRQAFYTNLRPGSYRFQVIAANEDGVWSVMPATVDIRVRPTFLQSWTFVALATVAFLLLLGLFYRWRLRQATHDVAKRHAERTAERERIARELHDTLLQGVQGLILTFQGVAGRLKETQIERCRLDEALQRADEVMVEGRERVRGLRR
jgi:ligand-binding sensor domain-containing protein